MKKEKRQKSEINIKVILLGESAVGKTCLKYIYLGKEWNDLTFLNDNSMRSSLILEKSDIILNVNIWDTIDQEKFRPITRKFIKGSNIILLIYDITRYETFLELEYWYNASYRRNKR